jgi:NAD(P)H-hydrate repair Nnr-like enzyme with NAD(P)H-hydrate epimerase domain
MKIKIVDVPSGLQASTSSIQLYSVTFRVMFIASIVTSTTVTMQQANRQTSVSRQRIDKHGYNRGTVESGVFCLVRPKAI